MPKLIPTRLSVEINPQDVDPQLLMEAMSAPTSPVSQLQEASGSKKDKKAEKKAARERMTSFRLISSKSRCFGNGPPW